MFLLGFYLGVVPMALCCLFILNLPVFLGLGGHVLQCVAGWSVSRQSYSRWVTGPDGIYPPEVVGEEWSGPGCLLPVLVAVPVGPMGALPLPTKGSRSWSHRVALHGILWTSVCPAFCGSPGCGWPW